MLPRRPKLRKSITLRDVAKYAGVSPKTVSNVINNWPYITDATRQKVQDAIDTLGYRPSGLATSLRTGWTNTIGVMIPDITNPFFGQAVRGCEDVLYAAGYSIFLCNTGEDPEKERTYLDMLVSRGVDGLLMFGARSNDAVLTAIVHDAIPIVAEDSPAKHNNTTGIDIDNVSGARMATEHLAARGHKRIGHLAGIVGRQAAETRIEGYRQGLENAGLSYERDLVYRCMHSIRGGYQSALRIIQEQKPTALFCYNDLMAIGAMVACRQLDLDVPKDMAIVGFDDIAIASLVEPALTTVRVRQYEMGRLASQLLLERLSGKKIPPAHILFPVELVVRSSCGARRLSRKQLNEMLEHLFKTELADLTTCGPDEDGKTVKE
jgi:LacI family transcriptional regulator